jgi:uncharacterized protein (DUF952 family)
MNIILHITPKSKWLASQASGSYQSDSLATEGFIHCSRLTQLIGSADRFFYGQRDLVILAIDRALVRAEVIDEGDDPNNLFPHIYGRLNLDAVTQTIDFAAGDDGLFTMPSELPNQIKN